MEFVPIPILIHIFNYNIVDLQNIDNVNDILCGELFINSQRISNLKECYNYFRVCKFWKYCIQEYVKTNKNLFIIGVKKKLYIIPKSMYRMNDYGEMCLYVFSPFSFTDDSKYKVYDINKCPIELFEIPYYIKQANIQHLNNWNLPIRLEHCTKFCIHVYENGTNIAVIDWILSKVALFTTIPKISSEFKNLQDDYILQGLNNNNDDCYYCYFNKNQVQYIFTRYVYMGIVELLKTKMCLAKSMKIYLNDKYRIMEDKKIVWETYK